MFSSALYERSQSIFLWLVLASVSASASASASVLVYAFSVCERMLPNTLLHWRTDAVSSRQPHFFCLKSNKWLRHWNTAWNRDIHPSPSCAATLGRRRSTLTRFAVSVPTLLTIVSAVARSHKFLIFYFFFHITLYKLLIKEIYIFIYLVEYKENAF